MNWRLKLFFNIHLQTHSKLRGKAFSVPSSCLSPEIILSQRYCISWSWDYHSLNQQMWHIHQCDTSIQPICSWLDRLSKEQTESAKCFNCCSIKSFFNCLLLFNYSFPHFLPLLSPAYPASTFHSQPYPPPVSLSLCPLFLDLTLHLHSMLSPFPSPLVTVSLFFISMSLALFCLLVCFID